MNEVQIFSKEEFGQLRTVVVGDEVLFVGLDVAKMLEYAYPSKAVIDHCKGITKLVIPSEGGEQQTNCITLGDVLRLIVKAADQSRNPSIKEKASKIERWIFDEVMPTVLQHGAYATPAKQQQFTPYAATRQTTGETSSFLREIRLIAKEGGISLAQAIWFATKYLQAKGEPFPDELAELLLKQEESKALQSKQLTLFVLEDNKGA